MRAVGKGVSGGRKGDVVDPSACRGGGFGAEGVERETRSPHRRIRTLIDVFDEGTENAGLMPD